METKMNELSSAVGAVGSFNETTAPNEVGNGLFLSARTPVAPASVGGNFGYGMSMGFGCPWYTQACNGINGIVGGSTGGSQNVANRKIFFVIEIFFQHFFIFCDRNENLRPPKNRKAAKLFFCSFYVLKFFYYAIFD